MKDTKTIINQLENGNFDERLLDIYVDKEVIAYQKNRYKKAIQSFVNCWTAN